VTFGSRPLRDLEARARVFSYMPDEAEPPPEVRVETLVAHAERFGRPPPRLAANLVAQLGLKLLLRERVGRLSRGQKRRVLFFSALCTSRPVVVLDEPLAAFDPLQLLDVLPVLRNRAAAGITLLLSAHQMTDAEKIASRVLVLDAGTAIAPAGRSRSCVRRRGAPTGRSRTSCSTCSGLGTDMLARELAITLRARVTWLQAALAALLVGHGFVLAIDLYSAGSRSAATQRLMGREFDPLLGIVRPTLGGLYLAISLLSPLVAARPLAVEKERRTFGALLLQVRSPMRLVGAKAVTALVGVGLQLVAPVVLLTGWWCAGGHLGAGETAVAFLAYALYLVATG
jgi:energy-coupling factor transporter ATP-binding protein EcfA2